MNIYEYLKTLELRIENPCVPSSILGAATIFHKKAHFDALFYCLEKGHYATRLTLQAQKTLNLTDCAVVRLSILVNYNIINLTYYVFVI